MALEVPPAGTRRRRGRAAAPPPPGAAATVLEVQVCNLAGDYCRVAVNRGDRVRTLKAGIKQMKNLCPIAFRLLDGTRELQDWDVLKRANILTLVMHSQQQVVWLQELEGANWAEMRQWLSEAPEAALADRTVVLKAIANYWPALEHVSSELKSDGEVVRRAVAKSGNALAHASPELQDDRSVVLSAVCNSGWVLKYASPRLQGDREVVLQAIANHPTALEWVSPELRGDREVVLAAVTQNGFALSYASPELKADREIVEKAVATNRCALLYASPELTGFLDPLRGQPLLLGAVGAPML